VLPEALGVLEEDDGVGERLRGGGLVEGEQRVGGTGDCGGFPEYLACNLLGELVAG
jgi:hypothetical protein